MIKIESTSNQKVKFIKSLRLSKFRKQHGVFMIEGEKIVLEAMKYHKPESVYVSETYYNEKNIDFDDDKLFVVSDKIFETLCETKTPQGIIAILQIPQNLELQGDAIVALEDVQNPLNVGTIIRSADAFGAGGVLLSDKCADIYSSKVLRGTMGSIFHLPVVKSDNFHEDLKKLQQDGYRLIAGDLKGGKLRRQDGKSVLIVGNEGNGISDTTREICDELWKIEMKGNAESLNAAVASSIMLYTMMN